MKNSRRSVDSDMPCIRSRNATLPTDRTRLESGSREFNRGHQCIQVGETSASVHLNRIIVVLYHRIWLIQQRIPSLLAHLNCRVYTRLPSLNPKHELIAPFLNNSFYIELLNNEGYYIVN